MNHQTIIVLDFGGQYNQLIARRVRECGVYCEVKPYTTPLADLLAMKPIGFIFTGGPNSVYLEDAPHVDPALFDAGVPVLGICYGCQLIAHHLGGRVVAANDATAREYGKTETFFDTNCKLFKGLPEKSVTWMSHGDYMEKVPEGFSLVAHSDACPNVAICDETRGFYGVQYHPEVNHTEFGTAMIRNFLYEVCGATGDWTMGDYKNTAIAAVREALTRTLANELADESLAVYNANKLDSYRVEHADIGKRALRNTCLRYLAFAEPTLGDKLVATQYHQADNMTDALAALSAAVAAELPCRDALMQEYDDKWHQDGLVMDKWFILQSTSPAANVVETVRGLLNHRSFSMSNPNRVRSLIGAFASSNPAAFHAEDGSGYQFLVEMLTELNQRNPQVASRLIEPLIRLKRYDEKRQALMRAALEQLKGLENLSGDLFEKISKALA